MRLQANHRGAWANVALPVGTVMDASQPEDEQLKALSERLCPGARGRRIVQDQTVLWLWHEAGGWQRSRWWHGCP